MKPSKAKSNRILAGVGILILMALSCTWSLFQPNGTASPPPPTTVPGQPAPTPVSLPLAETSFSVALPAPLPGGATLSVAVLDEVTGLPLNPAIYPLQMLDAQHYGGKLALPVGGVVKYRYIYANGPAVQEDTTFEQLVRYRMLLVSGPGSISDIIASWEGQPFDGGTGRAQGQILNTTTGAPLADVLVALGGEQTFTDSLGNFAIDNLVPGTHNMLVYALDGTYGPFQQGVTIAANAVTPVAVGLQPAKSVRVTFNVNVPSNTVAGAPLRLAGNLTQLGNTFADLTGGVNTLASRMPVMTPAGDGRYSITMNLPVGAYIQYKYTLGDGLWNAEHKSDGPFRLRELIVPSRDLVVEDAVQTWEAGNSAPILFEVDAPADTPAGDFVSIQFNPYGWTEALPMWPLGNNRWVYKLFGPFNVLGNFGYRYCRNDQCGSADDAATPGHESAGRHVATSLTPQDLRDTIQAWEWLPASQQPAVVAVPVTPRAAGFVAGIDFQKYYHPTFLPLYAATYQNIQSMGANWAILEPTWTVASNSPLIFAPTPQSDPLWSDAAQSVQQARSLGLNVALFPRVRFASPALSWEGAAPSDAAYWFERYRGFVLYHADLASQNSAQSIILGGEDLPAALIDGPGAEERFRSLIGEVRQHFNGVVLWALPYPGSMQSVPAFLDAVDGIYLLWSAPLAQGSGATVDEMKNEAGRLLDSDILPFIVSIQKAVIIAIDYPSADGAAEGCVPASAGGCLAPQALSRPLPDIPTVVLNTQVQADLYQAVLMAINERNWISGVTSRSYYQPAELEDKSESIHGKPTANQIWYWYPRLLGLVQ